MRRADDFAVGDVTSLPPAAARVSLGAAWQTSAHELGLQSLPARACVRVPLSVKRLARGNLVREPELGQAEEGHEGQGKSARD